MCAAFHLSADDWTANMEVAFAARAKVQPGWSSCQELLSLYELSATSFTRHLKSKYKYPPKEYNRHLSCRKWAEEEGTKIVYQSEYDWRRERATGVY